MKLMKCFPWDLRKNLTPYYQKRQSKDRTLLFSATMPREIVGIAKKYMKNAEEISAGTKNIGAENVNHYFYMVSARDRYSALKRIADINPKIYGIVFAELVQKPKMWLTNLCRMVTMPMHCMVIYHKHSGIS